jgi:organic radical activating enzyme
MAKYSWSEVFTSIEGEGIWSGTPTVYVRFTGCNFTCSGFNNPENVDTTTIETLGFDPKDYTNIYDIPVISKGCDSIYSWDNKFKHMWETGDENQLAGAIMAHVPRGSWQHPVTGQPVILSLTGGEPTLRAKHLLTILNHPDLVGLTKLLIETNCSVPLTREFIDGLYAWGQQRPDRQVIWSNSPKLSVSGEPWEKAIRPDIALQQTTYMFCRDANIQQYFKFVCGPSSEDFDEVDRAMEQYYAGHVCKGVGVYIMPVACQQLDQTEISAQVARMCIERGYTYCHRVHLDVFGNAVGT